MTRVASRELRSDAEVDVLAVDKGDKATLLSLRRMGSVSSSKVERRDYGIIQPPARVPEILAA
jgi:hypothetical protein